MNLYEAIETLSNNIFSKYEVENTIDKFVRIEYSKNYRRESIKNARNSVNINLSTLHECLTDKLLSISDNKDKFTIKELAQILQCSESTIKNWKKAGVLKVDQDCPKCSILISIDAVDNLLYSISNTKYIKRWENFKK